MATESDYALSRAGESRQLVGIPIAPTDRLFCGFGLEIPPLSHVCFRFDTHLDRSALARAVLAATIEHPILRSVCDLVNGRHWHPRPTGIVDTMLDFVESFDTDQVERARERFMHEPLDLRSMPPLRLLVIRERHCDSLVLTMHHAVGDGAALLNVCDVIRNAYAQLKVNPRWWPAAPLRARPHALLAQYGGMSNLLSWWARVPRAWWSGLRVPASDGWGATQPLGRRVERQQRIVEFEPEVFAHTRALARARGYSMNDVLAATLALVWRSTRQAQQLEAAAFVLHVSVDLRRWRTEGVHPLLNLSGEMVPWVARSHYDSPAFVDRVLWAMRRCRAPLAGVPGWVTLDSLMRLAPSRWIVPRLVEWDRAMQTRTRRPCRLSNLGSLPQHLAQWGEVRAEDVYVTTAAPNHASLFAIAQTWQGHCRIVLVYPRGGIPKAQADLLVDRCTEAFATVSARLAMQASAPSEEAPASPRALPAATPAESDRRLPP